MRQRVEQAQGNDARGDTWNEIRHEDFGQQLRHRFDQGDARAQAGCGLRLRLEIGNHAFGEFLGGYAAMIGAREVDQHSAQQRRQEAHNAPARAQAEALPIWQQARIAQHRLQRLARAWFDHAQDGRHQRACAAVFERACYIYEQSFTRFCQHLLCLIGDMNVKGLGDIRHKAQEEVAPQGRDGVEHALHGAK